MLGKCGAIVGAFPTFYPATLESNQLLPYSPSAMTTQQTVTGIIENIRAHAEEYGAPLGESLHALAQQICTSENISPTVRKLFGSENGLYRENPNRDEDIAQLFSELGLPKL